MGPFWLWARKHCLLCLHHRYGPGNLPDLQILISKRSDIWESFLFLRSSCSSSLVFSSFLLLLLPVTPQFNFPLTILLRPSARFRIPLPQSFHSFVWGTFCLFLAVLCGIVLCGLGCVVSWRQLLRAAFQSRIELGLAAHYSWLNTTTSWSALFFLQVSIVLNCYLCWENIMKNQFSLLQAIST